MFGGMIRRAIARDIRRSGRRSRSRKPATGFGTVAHGQRRRAAKLAAERASAAQVQAARAAAARAAQTASEPQRNRWGLVQPDPSARTIAGRWGV